MEVNGKQSICHACEWLVQVEDDLVGVFYQRCNRDIPIRNRVVTKCKRFEVRQAPSLLLRTAWTRDGENSWEDSNYRTYRIGEDGRCERYKDDDD